jgi:FkbM family methyltransferase
MSVIKLPYGLSTLRRLDFPHKIGVLDRVYGRVLSSHGHCALNTYCAIDWELDLRSPSNRRAVYSEYSGLGFARWARHWLRDGGTVIDVGANIGQTVMLFAPCRDVKVLAIDPNPECLSWIKRCLGRYPEWNVELVNVGLSDQAGELTLTIPEFTGEQGGQATMRSDWYRTRRKSSLMVPVKTTDEILEAHNIDRVRLWKLDVEGWEHKVLEGAKKAFEKGRIDALFAEVHPSNRDFFQSFMKKHGLSLCQVGKGGDLASLADSLPEAEDYLAIRKDLL